MNHSKAKHETPDSPAERLLTAILADTAGLEDAACRGEHDLFDPRDHDRDETPESARDRHTEAAGICAACPVVEACRVFAERENSTDSVLAAVVPAHRAPGRPRTDTAA